jgi:antitoxin component YwqK of YwqJK toxin-antitoxin module
VLTSYSEVDSNLRPVGKILKYYDDGSIMVSGQAKGLKNGVWKYFNKDGTLNHEEIWDNGVVK